MKTKKRTLTQNTLYDERFFLDKLGRELLFFLVFLLLSSFIMTACTKEGAFGVLRVNSMLSGRYEVYRLKGQDSSQIVSEKIGQYNQDCILPVGRYLVLADCSSQNVTINSKQIVEIYASSVQFKTPVKPNSGDLFSVQCVMQNLKTSTRQNFLNTYDFNFIGKTVHLLVNLYPVEIKLKELKTGFSQVIEYSLSAFKVLSRLEGAMRTPYFITPGVPFASRTQAQQLNHWIFLPSGQYQISLNGTYELLLLKKGEVRVLNASYLLVSLAEKRVQELYQSRLGRSFDLFINKTHLLSFNEIYPLLPGIHRVSFDKSQRSINFESKKGEVHRILANSITVARNCSPWEWECLGKKDVMVFSQNLEQFFYEGATDVPLIYYENKISLSMRSSKGIYYQLINSNEHEQLKVGTLFLVPKPVLHHDKTTELVRVEAIQKPLVGHSQDIPFGRVTKMLLFQGKYHVSLYIKKRDGTKERVRKIIKIKGGDTNEYIFPYLLPPKKYQKQQKKYVKIRQAKYYKDRKKKVVQELIN